MRIEKSRYITGLSGMWFFPEIVCRTFAEVSPLYPGFEAGRLLPESGALAVCNRLPNNESRASSGVWALEHPIMSRMVCGEL